MRSGSEPERLPAQLGRRPDPAHAPLRAAGNVSRKQW
jgi:hypothetical protein